MTRARATDQARRCRAKSSFELGPRGVRRLHRWPRSAVSPRAPNRIEERRGPRAAVGEVELPPRRPKSRAPLCAIEHCKVTPAGPTRPVAPMRRRHRDAPRARERPSLTAERGPRGDSCCPALVRRNTARRARFAARAGGPLTPAAPDVEAPTATLAEFDS